MAMDEFQMHFDLTERNSCVPASVRRPCALEQSEHWRALHCVRHNESHESIALDTLRDIKL